MSLTSGMRLGPYEIVGALGAGGMGEVFRARDTKLNRDVAIKVLPAAFADDPERLARFTREAQTLAALNHPNIAAIHGIEEVPAVTGSAGPGSRALVMELVEGEDLSTHIARGPIPIAEALPIARQIAEALEAAHEQGIVHRDLKPANIKVRTDGTVKILDFGLAKAMDGDSAANSALSHSPTMSRHMTEAGMIIGTAAYMSPEQAKGKAVDKRTDIWAFGVVLYEMLTGKRAFKGDDVSETLASVLKDTLSMDALPATTPPRLKRLIERCLDRDLKARLRDIGEARLKIARIEAGDVDSAVSATPITAAGSVARVRLLSALVAVLAIALISSLVAWAPWRTGPVPFETRLDIATPTTDDPVSFAISPDGRQIVYAASGEGGSRLWLRGLDTTTAEPLSGTDGGRYPFWSPDSRSIAFFASGNLMRLDLGGGRPQTLTSLTATSSGGGAWNEQGVILFGDRRALHRVAATGGDAVAVTKLAHQGEHRSPAFLPGGRQFLFVATGSQETRGVYLGSLDSPEPRRLLAVDVEGARYLPPSWLLWIQSKTLRAQRLDLRNARLVGDPVTIAAPASGFSVSDSGPFAYRTTAREQARLAWFDRTGKALGTLSPRDEAGVAVFGPRISPDRRRVVANSGRDIWLFDEARASRFTFNPEQRAQPVWSPDASRIVYGSARKGAVRDLYIKPSGGSGAEELLLESALDKNPNDWSRDGRFLLMHNNDPETGADLWVLPMTGPSASPKGQSPEGSAGARAPWVFLKTKFAERWARFSPDGRFVAYMSNESGRAEIYVRPFMEGGGGAGSGQWQVSTAGGISPVWRADGAELYYLAPDGTLMAAPIRVHGAELSPGAPVPLFRPRILGGGADVGIGPQYDVSKDGRFLFNTVAEDTPLAPITLIQNWNPERKK